MTPWIIACPVPLSLGFARKEYWSGLSFPSPNPVIEPWSPALQVDSLPTEPPGKPKKVTILLPYSCYVQAD